MKFKYVHSKLNDDGYQLFIKENLHFNLAISLVKFANNDYTMNDWLEDIESDYLEKLVETELFSETESDHKDDILLTLTLLSMYGDGSGIHEDQVEEKWKMLRASLTLENMRRKGLVDIIKIPKKFKFSPNSTSKISPYVTHEGEDENYMKVTFKGMAIKNVSTPIERDYKPSKNDIEYPIGTVWIYNKTEAFVLDEIVHYSFNEKPTAKWSLLHTSKWARKNKK